MGRPLTDRYTLVLYRGEDCMKKICTSLREYTTNVNNFEKEKMLLFFTTGQIMIANEFEW